MINSVIKTCRDFVEKVLKKEDWFRQLTDNKDYDLLLLTGTAVEQTLHAQGIPKNNGD